MTLRLNHGIMPGKPAKRWMLIWHLWNIWLKPRELSRYGQDLVCHTQSGAYWIILQTPYLDRMKSQKFTLQSQYDEKSANLAHIPTISSGVFNVPLNTIHFCLLNWKIWCYEKISQLLLITHANQTSFLRPIIEVVIGIVKFVNNQLCSVVGLSYVNVCNANVAANAVPLKIRKCLSSNIAGCIPSQTNEIAIGVIFLCIMQAWLPDYWTIWDGRWLNRTNFIVATWSHQVYGFVATSKLPFL